MLAFNPLRISILYLSITKVIRCKPPKDKMDSHSDPPPPYSVTPPPNSTTPPTNDIASSRSPPLAPVTLRVAQRFPRPVTAREQLQRYLIEIITFELAADSSSVSRALGQDGPAASSQENVSILADDEKNELLLLAMIVEDLYQKFTHNRWASALDCDRKSILRTIIRPSRSMNIYADYVMDLISTYAK
jgi:hypothetical protein